MNTENNIPEDFDLIDRFVRGEMSATERELFEQRLSGDQRLQQQVHEMKLIAIGVQETVLRERLNDFHEELPKITVRRFPFMRLLAAASVLLVLAAGTWWAMQARDADQQLFSEYFEPDPGLLSQMSSSDNYIFDRAMIDYKTGNYRAALASWQQLEAAGSASDTLYYFLGSAALAMRDGKLAIHYYQKSLNAGPAFADDANWYTGLALLLQKERDKAIPYLEKTTREEKQRVLQQLKK